MRWLPMLIATISLSACGSAPEQSAAPTPADDFKPDSRPMGKTMVYECSGAEFITRVGPGEMALWFEDRYLILSQVRAASGSRYEEGDVLFWSKGDEVMLEVQGVRYSDCRLNPARAPWEDARRRGVEFRAVGNEPGWHLEVRGEQNLLFVGDYGGTRMLFTDITATPDAEQLHYQAQQDDTQITVTVTETFCTDTMKGEQFPYTVLVQLNDRSYQGCGRALDHPWE